MINVINKHRQNREWRIPIMDGCGSHTMTVDSLSKMWEENMFCGGMPAHTSSEAQPCDKVLFCPVKKCAHNAMDDYILDRYADGDPDATFSVWDLPAFMEKGIIEGSKMENIINGFVECGIYPLDLEWTSKPHNQAKLRISDPLKVVITAHGEGGGGGGLSMEIYLQMHSCVAAARVASKLCNTDRVSASTATIYATIYATAREPTVDLDLHVIICLSCLFLVPVNVRW